MSVIAQIQLSFETRFLSLQIGLVTGLSFVKGNEVVYKERIFFPENFVVVAVVFLYFNEMTERSCIYFVVSCIKHSNFRFLFLSH